MTRYIDPRLPRLVASAQRSPKSFAAESPASAHRNNQRVAFMDKSFGDAFVIDLKTRKITCLTCSLATWFAIMTGLALGIWLYYRASGRFNLRPLTVKFERVETVTLTHILLTLILLVMVASFSELVNVKKATSEVENSITNLQNSASDSTDEIKSKLDDVTSVIEATQ